MGCTCRACGSEWVYKHGGSRSGEPHYRCRECHCCFQLNDRNEANKVGVLEKILTMTLNGSRVRDTARVLGMSTNTVLAHLKNPQPPAITPLPLGKVAAQYGMNLVLEMDELWSYVGKKSQQRWLWSAWSPHFKRIVAYALGWGEDSILQVLLERLKPWTVWPYCSDGWGAYQRHLPADQHLSSKRYQALYAKHRAAKLEFPNPYQALSPQDTLLL